MTGDVEKWGDLQQYRSEPHSGYEGPQRGVIPKTTLLWMTPDPLGAIAAMAAMYEGRVVRDLSELTHEDRVRYWNEVRSTHLDTPLEAVTFQFLLEGVDRSFTHQLVRKRVGTAFAQESLRFAVPGSLDSATSLPPSLQGTKESDDWAQQGPDRNITDAQRWRLSWDHAMRSVDWAYHRLVESGMPAEEARGLLPHATATRVVYLVNLRSLLQEAGNRLCTQAQYHWRIVMAQMKLEIQHYAHRMVAARGGMLDESNAVASEFQLIADTFRPVCYEMGRCPFKASFDRDCTIRARVDQFAADGVPSSKWMDPPASGDSIAPISPAEWLLNPDAARRTGRR